VSATASAGRVITSIYLFRLKRLELSTPASIARPACSSTRCVVP